MGDRFIIKRVMDNDGSTQTREGGLFFAKYCKRLQNTAREFHPTSQKNENGHSARIAVLPDDDQCILTVRWLFHEEKE